MSQKTLIQLIDDIDQTSEAAETVRFGLDGVGYEIDLTARRASELRAVFGACVEHGRVVSATGGAVARAGRVRRTPEVDTMLVRAWAIREGIEINGRGRIPGNILEKYRSRGTTTAPQLTLPGMMRNPADDAAEAVAGVAPEQAITGGRNVDEARAVKFTAAKQPPKTADDADVTATAKPRTRAGTAKAVATHDVPEATAVRPKAAARKTKAAAPAKRARPAPLSVQEVPREVPDLPFLAGKRYSR